MKEYYSNGKLLITGEYFVLDGAISLAVPTTCGQDLIVESIKESQLIWESYDPYNLLWNGSSNGGNYYVSDGIYYWYFRGRKFNSSYVEELNGYITILR